MTITNAEEFVQLRSSDDPNDYRRAAEEDAPLAVWLEVIDQHEDLRRWVVHNKTVPVEVLERLAGDPNAEVRWAIAMKRKTPPSILERLAKDSEPDVRLRVAGHRSTPIEALRVLAEDTWEQVRVLAEERLRASADG